MSESKAASSRWPVPPRTAAVLLIIAFLVVVSSALATEGAMLRRNVSGTPDLETENAQLGVAQFYIDAQRANGTLVKDEEFVEQTVKDEEATRSSAKTGSRSRVVEAPGRSAVLRGDRRSGVPGRLGATSPPRKIS